MAHGVILKDVKRQPHVGPNDYHIIFRARSRKLICFDGHGTRRWTLEAHGEGIGGSCNAPSGATPPGLYECTKVQPTLNSESSATWNSFGPYHVWLREMEGQESSRGREGIGMHGGEKGSPDPTAPRQGFYPTKGCVRLQNADLPRLVSAVRTSHEGGTTYLTVTWTC